MAQVSFKIGDANKRDLKDASTIYKQTISSRPQGVPQARSTTNLALKGSNINFGNELKVGYISEAKEKFVPQSTDQANAAIDHAKLRSSHFTLQESEKANYFSTVNNIDFNYKGDARNIRSRISQETKDNQRASHFKVGFEN